MVALLTMAAWVVWAVAFCPEAACENLSISKRLLLAFGGLVLAVPFVSVMLAAEEDRPGVMDQLRAWRILRRFLLAIGVLLITFEVVFGAGIHITPAESELLFRVGLTIYGLAALTIFRDLWVLLNCFREPG